MLLRSIEFDRKMRKGIAIDQKDIAKCNQTVLYCETGVGPVMGMARLKPV